MNRAISILKCMALATVPVVGAFAIWILWPIRAALQQNSAGVAGLVAKANIALDAINRPCAPGPCGLLAQTDKLEAHTSDLLIQSQIAVRHADQVSQTEAAMLPVWNAKVTTTLDSVGAVTASLAQAAHQATTTLATASTTIAAAQPVLTRTDATLDHLDDLVTSKVVTDTLQNVADTTKAAAVATRAAADATQQGAAILADARKGADKLAAPKPHHWYSWLETAGQDTGTAAYWLYRLSH